VRAIGLSSQGQTFVPLDAAGRPLRNAIVWLDTRATEQCRRIAAHFDAQDAYPRTGTPRFTDISSAPKILWLREHEPEVFARTAHYLMLPDYVIWRLTGEMIGDPQDLASTGMLDRQQGHWWPEMLEFVGVREEQLPAVGYCGQAVGTVLPQAARLLGISEDAIVVVGANDQTAALLGAGNVRPGIITASIGTALAVMASTKQGAYEATRGVNVGPHAVPGLYALLSFTQTAAMALTWFRDALVTDGSDYGQLHDEAASVEPGCEGLLMLPHLTGTASPDFNPDARGAFVGLSLSHGRRHMVRAILEAAAYCLREHIERLAGLGAGSERVRAIGGGSRSDVWLQIMADVTGLPIERPVCREAASLGAAIMAAVGAGYFDSLVAAADRFYETERAFAPDASHSDTYDRMYERFRRTYEVLYGAKASG
jgi:xylulokinase